MGLMFRFEGEYGAEQIWGGRWKYHLAPTMFCRTELYVCVTAYAERSLEFFDGIPFALSDAWEHFDALAKAYEGSEQQRQDECWADFRRQVREEQERVDLYAM